MMFKVKKYVKVIWNAISTVFFVVGFMLTYLGEANFFLVLILGIMALLGLIIILDELL